MAKRLRNHWTLPRNRPRKSGSGHPPFPEGREGHPIVMPSIPRITGPIASVVPAPPQPGLGLFAPSDQEGPTTSSLFWPILASAGAKRRTRSRTKTICFGTAQPAGDPSKAPVAHERRPLYQTTPARHIHADSDVPNRGAKRTRVLSFAAIKKASRARRSTYGTTGKRLCQSSLQPARLAKCVACAGKQKAQEHGAPRARAGKKKARPEGQRGRAPGVKKAGTQLAKENAKS